MRCEIAYVPPPDDPLTTKAAGWLGRDPYSGSVTEAQVEGLTRDDRSYLTALPRRFGFHATLKPPFVLEQGHTDHELGRRLGEFAKNVRPLPTVHLRIALIDTFFALVPAHPAPELMHLAANIVAEFDAFRLPMTPEDVDRRSAARYSPVQLANLRRWGSAFVFDQFHFHMTLTGPVDRNEREHVQLVLNRYFGSAPIPVAIDRLSLSVQHEPHDPYRIHSTHLFEAAPEIRIAS
jgi:hypothetical protein